MNNASGLLLYSGPFSNHSTIKEPFFALQLLRKGLLSLHLQSPYENLALEVHFNSSEERNDFWHFVEIEVNYKVSRLMFFKSFVVSNFIRTLLPVILKHSPKSIKPLASLAGPMSFR